MYNTNNFVVPFLDSIGFRNDANSSIKCVFLRDQIEPLLIHNYITCRRNCTVVRERKLVTITENCSVGGRSRERRRTYRTIASSFLMY